MGRHRAPVDREQELERAWIELLCALLLALPALIVVAWVLGW